MTNTEGGRVFLIAQPTVKRDGSYPNLEPLADHGELTTVIEAASKTSRRPDEALHIIARKLVDFNHEEDSIAWAGGGTLPALMIGSVLACKGVPWFWWLRWDRKWDEETGALLDEGHYVKVKIDLEPIYKMYWEEDE